jgi:cysteine desulfuration protein SufE
MATIIEIQNKIIDAFSGMDDWLDKYSYLINLGKNHPSLEPNLKNEKTALKGCQSQVWIYAELRNEKLFFLADSDSIITKGIIALLIEVLSNQKPRDVMEADLYFIKEIGLSTNLSPSRALGLATIINHMKQLGER